jgi:cyclopropane fatty-acyl-phospholipid synthase-like methyltransferase
MLPAHPCCLTSALASHCTPAHLHTRTPPTHRLPHAHSYEDYCATSDFIREHIFPGGHLPCMGAMVEAARGTGLTVHAVQDIGPDYAITLREWRQRWEERKAEVLALGYSERFWRKYRWGLVLAWLALLLVPLCVHYIAFR